MTNKLASELTVIAAADIDDDADFITVHDTSAVELKAITSQDYLRGKVGLEPAETDSFILNPADNSIGAGCDISAVLGSGDATRPNKIGELNGLPVGTDVTPGWSADSGYVAGAADVAFIAGGYDQIVNSIGSAIFHAPHSMISYTAAGHNWIIGGSYNWISAARSTILGGRQNEITGGNLATFNTILGGDDNTISGSGGDYNIVLNGTDVNISSTGLANLAGGNNCDITGGDYNFVYGNGSSYTGSADGNIIIGPSHSAAGTASGILGGSANTLGASANNCFILGGTENNLNEVGSVAQGNNVLGVQPGAHYIGTNDLNETGDAQSYVFTAAARTTNATVQSIRSQNNVAAFSTSRITSFVGKVLLVAMRDGSADGDNDNSKLMATWHLEFGGQHDGPGAARLLHDAAGESTATAPSRNLTTIRDNITITTAPTVEISGSEFRVRVTGLAATTINWVARVEIAMTLID